MYECLVEELLLYCNVSERNVQHNFESLDNQRRTGTDELPQTPVKPCTRNLSKSLAKFSIQT